MPRFVVDTAQSTVQVGLRVNLHPSHINANALAGFIECEIDDQGKPRLDQPYRAELTLPVDAIKSGNGIQDREMRRRFDISRYPEITAVVTHGEALDGEGRYRATAQLTMHGVTKDITGDLTLGVSGTTMTVDGQQVMNVKDFGIDPPRLIILKVEPDVDLQVHIVAQRQS
ncbi:MAG TPA: YceI family protein [Candidatus Dormibacteraeota bacterium]|nr:YceI family protein [Candidatus Dormibacteraeota bacterium]